MFKQKLSLAFIIVLILMNSLYVSAITGSMGNARMILYPEVNGWFATEIEKSILVKNVNDVPISIQLKVDEEGKEFIELIDEEFVLQANQEKKAQFIVKVRKEGTYNGKINVFFTPLDGEGPGVVLSSEIVVIAKKTQDYEEDEDEEDEENGEEEDDVSIGTGSTISDDDESSKPIIFLSVSTFILIIALGGVSYLYVQKSKKRVKKTGGKINGKNKK